MRQGWRDSRWGLVCLTAVLCACEAGRDDPPPARASNSAPLIAGTPARTVAVGTTYSFSPAAGDSDGDSLTFGIDGKPPWAAFDTRTGELAGKPGLSNAGVYREIVVWVSDGAARTELAPFDLTVTSPSATNRAPPTQNTDSTPLTDLAGYTVYWGTAQGTYPNSVTLSQPGLASYRIENLASGTYYFVITAFNSEGVESEPSNVASITLPRRKAKALRPQRPGPRAAR